MWGVGPYSILDDPGEPLIGVGKEFLAFLDSLDERLTNVERILKITDYEELDSVIERFNKAIQAIEEGNNE